MDDEYASQLELGGALVTWAFITEMAMKLTGMGCEDYWSDGWNRTHLLTYLLTYLPTYLGEDYWSDGWNQLDGSIVILSAAEMVCPPLSNRSIK